jgi:hypothetical protein
MNQKIDKPVLTKELPRRPYHSPMLATYGAIRELTTSGSVQTPEGSGTGNRFKRP